MTGHGGGRAERVGLQIRRELAELVHAVKDPRVGDAALVTVTHVRVSDDLGVADVLVSVIGGDAHAVVAGIERAASWLRRELGGRLRAKKVPALRFHVDETGDRAERIDALLREVAGDAPVGDGAEAAAPVEPAGDEE